MYTKAQNFLTIKEGCKDPLMRAKLFFIVFVAGHSQREAPPPPPPFLCSTSI